MKSPNESIVVDLGSGGAEEVRTICLACSPHRSKSKQKCLAVNRSNGVFFCHHCQDSGITDQFKDNQMNFNVYQEKPKVYSKPKVPAELNLSDKAYAWFKSRGISADTLIRNKVYSDIQWMPEPDKEVTVIGFPFFRGQEIINVKYRDARKSWKQTTGAEKILYGLNDIIDQDSFFITEGEIDKLSLEEAGYKNSCSVPDGAPNPNTKNFDKKFSYMESCFLPLEKASSIYCCFDNDTNGKVLLEEFSRRVGREKCMIVSYPEDCKDINEVLIKYGKEKVRECIATAKPYPIEGIHTAKSQMDSMLRIFDNGKKKGVTTGYSDLDLHYTLRTSELDIWTGIPNMGKSAMVFQMIMNSAHLYGWKWGVYSPENYPISELYDSLSELVVGNTTDIDVRDRMSKDEYLGSIDYLNEYIYTVYPEEDLSLDNILEKFKYLVLRYGIKGCVIDPFNQLDNDRGGLSETEYIGQALSKIRRFEQLYDLKFIIVAHPRIMHQDERGVYQRPTAYHISGSANWFNKADNVIVIHRENTKDPHDTSVLIDVQKVKFQKLVGIPGEIRLFYDRRSGRYLDHNYTCPLDGISQTYSQKFRV
jgi:twinkle protein